MKDVAGAAGDKAQPAAGPGRPGDELPPDAPDVTLVVPVRTLVKWAACLKAASNLLWRLAEDKNGVQPACAPDLERLAAEQGALARAFLRRAEKACQEAAPAGDALPLDLAETEPEARSETAFGKL